MDNYFVVGDVFLALRTHRVPKMLKQIIIALLTHVMQTFSDNQLLLGMVFQIKNAIKLITLEQVDNIGVKVAFTI